MSNPRQVKKFLLFLVILAAAAAAWVFLPLDRFPEFVDWVRGQGLLGALLLGGVYVVATVLMIPGSLITLAIGAIYGPWLGSALVSPASVLGATLAFLLGRGLLRPSIERRMAASRRFQALAGAIEREGFKILFLVRLSPVFPFTVINYAFGLTRVRLRHFLVGSFLGMLPGTLMYVYLGSTVGDVSQLLSGGTPDAGAAGQAMKIVGLLATVVVTVLVTRLARRSLAAAAPEVVEASTTPSEAGA